MSRYIDADEVKKRLLSYYDCVNESTAKDNYRGETLMSYEVADMIEDCIENTPTADVQDVRHGHWIVTEDGDLQCSECGHFTFEIIGDIVVSDGMLIHCSMNPLFCSKCGARMDEEENSECLQNIQ